ncbi:MULTISPECIES: hypothetical protein [unclassified Microcoleus]|uniref:hypothetical protein n=1 Tax=unclassified Microcoleus TaxID=2642155 RepID=UPI0025CD772A|nr:MULTISPECIES: hypothetical protein [unclassified Microcoleus]
MSYKLRAIALQIDRFVAEIFYVALAAHHLAQKRCLFFSRLALDESLTLRRFQPSSPIFWRYGTILNNSRFACSTKN